MKTLRFERKPGIPGTKFAGEYYELLDDGANRFTVCVDGFERALEIYHLPIPVGTIIEVEIGNVYRVGERVKIG